MDDDVNYYPGGNPCKEFEIVSQQGFHNVHIHVPSGKKLDYYYDSKDIANDPEGWVNELYYTNKNNISPPKTGLDSIGIKIIIDKYMRKGYRDLRAVHCGISWTVFELIEHLNDSHRMSREEIADYLDSLDIDLTIQKGETK